MEVPESREREYKVIYTPTCLKTVSAFTNYLDGQIIFGIQDDQTVLGVENPRELMLSQEHAINDGITPHPDYMLSQYTRNGKLLVVLAVRKGLNPPYYFSIEPICAVILLPLLSIQLS